MAHRVLTDAYVSWDGNDFSDHVKQVTLSYEADAVDDTMMGDDAEVFLGGVKKWRVEVQFASDEAASEIGATLFADVGTTATLIIRPDNSDGVSATNPNYTGTALLTSFTPLEGQHGALAMSPAVFVSAGTLSRATA